MQIKATLILSTLAVFVAADKTSTDYCYDETTSGTVVYPTLYPTTIHPGKPTGGHGYNATYTGGSKTSLYTSAKPTTPVAPTTPGSTPPAATAGASKSEFAMAVLGLGLAAGLII
ncbi:hypothetical protein B0T14DRAFT_499075 [Immersiella caudata]|uniref:Uncharacterized protein n=1 Tax=Immersiella caudata TaxID=314043 RepID=A0AA40BU09_9PEZI|nr:hypothetical protein B0T14DRAFT_499075 [Immersiella caudata]